MSNNTITDGTATFLVRKIGGSGLIKGIIMAFSGSFDSNGYPIDPDTNTGDTGWHICDGTHGTPDLRGRFILGASDSYAVDSTGGEATHKLIIAEMPAHKHTGTTSTDGNHKHGTVGENTSVGTPAYGFYDSNNNHFGLKSGMDTDNSLFNTSTDGNHNHTFTTNNSGEDHPHNNMPPYYTLSYIMKV